MDTRDIQGTPTQDHQDGFSSLDELDKMLQSAVSTVGRKALELATPIAYRVLFQLAGSLPLGVATVSEKDLRNGDHVIVPRLMSQRQHIPAELQDKHRYFHHGIYIKEGPLSYVIALTRPPKRKVDISPDEDKAADKDVAVDEVDGPFAVAKEMIRRAALYGFLLVGNALVVQPRSKNNLIFKEDLDSFAAPVQDETHGKRYIRLAPEHISEEALHERREHTANVAKFFVQDEAHSWSFGTYNLLDWNCETFASFCTSTVLTRDQLEHALCSNCDERRRRQFLTDNSEMTNNGLELFLRCGIKAMFMQVTYEQLETCSQTAILESSRSDPEDSGYTSDGGVSGRDFSRSLSRNSCTWFETSEEYL